MHTHNPSVGGSNPPRPIEKPSKSLQGGARASGAPRTPVPRPAAHLRNPRHSACRPPRGHGVDGARRPGDHTEVPGVQAAGGRGAAVVGGVPGRRLLCCQQSPLRRFGGFPFRFLATARKEGPTAVAFTRGCDSGPRVRRRHGESAAFMGKQHSGAAFRTPTARALRAECERALRVRRDFSSSSKALARRA